MKQIFILFLFLYTVFCNSLHFDNDGKFKILQVTDTHFRDEKDPECVDISTTFTPCSYKNTTYFLSRSLDKEKPDLVVFSGDIVDWGTYNVTESLNELMEPVISRKIPWVGVLGNHDGQSGIEGGRKAVMKELTKMPYSYSEMGPEWVYGSGNYILNITKKEELLPRYQIMLADSNNYSHYDNKYKTEGYGWMQPSQLEYFTQNTYKKSKKFMYYHIPIWEYQEGVEREFISGKHQEKISPGILNSGLFSTLATIPNVLGTFVGHDHVNDFCVLYHTIQLCYSGSSGYNTYGRPDMSRRHRIVEIQDYGDRVAFYKTLDTPDLKQEDYEIIYSKNNPDEVDEYMKKRRFSGYLSLYQILTIIFVSTTFVLLSSIIYIKRIAIKSLFKKCWSCCKSCKIKHSDPKVKFSDFKDDFDSKL